MLILDAALSISSGTVFNEDVRRWVVGGALVSGAVLVAQPVAPGAEVKVRISPQQPELWSEVRVGSVIQMEEGGRATITHLEFAPGVTTGVLRFVAEARALCAFVGAAHELAMAERLEVLRVRLLELYRCALELPGDVSPQRRDEVIVAAREPTPTFAHQYYWEVFDPYVEAEPVVGDLVDDVLDIDRDVRRGLTLWDASAWLDAIWEWRFHFEHHWGDHAIDALRALHRACALLREASV